MADKAFRELLSRLSAELAVRKALVLADPEPYLCQLSKHSERLLIALRDVEYALSPDVVFDVANDMGIRPIDFQGEALVRCNKAREVLRKYREEG